MLTYVHTYIYIYIYQLIHTYIHTYTCSCVNTGTGSTTAFLAAMYCQKGITKYMEGYDFVIMNCGHHFAKHALYDYNVYSDVVRELAIGTKDANSYIHT